MIIVYDALVCYHATRCTGKSMRSCRTAFQRCLFSDHWLPEKCETIISHDILNASETSWNVLKKIPWIWFAALSWNITALLSWNALTLSPWNLVKFVQPVKQQQTNKQKKNLFALLAFHLPWHCFTLLSEMISSMIIMPSSSSSSSPSS